MKFQLLLLSLLFTSISANSQKYKIEKEPDWIKTIGIPDKSEVKKYDVSSGYYLALADYQVNLETNASYSHNVTNVVSYSGVTKASQLSISYDTAYQQLKIHHLYIWRNGEKIDRTSNLSFKTLNNEFNLHNGIYTGLITSYCNLNDIRKDDLIDFAYTLVGKNPIFKNEKYLFIPLETDNPVDLYSIRILYSKNKDYEYRCVGTDSSSLIASSVVGNYRELDINIPNSKAIHLEGNIPNGVIPYKYFTLSSFKSWKQVNDWAQEVCALKNEPDLSTVFKEIFTGKETIDEKVNKIINYVQDDIRYMGIEAGIGSIKPFKPDQVVKQRFGDCKDKSLLLVSLLKKIGITKAYPVLVNTFMKKEIEKFYPSNEVFNHCIVRFELNDSVYWVDPTFTEQGGDYKKLSMTNYEKALIIGIPSDTLSDMHIREMSQMVNITDVFTIKSFTDPASLVIKSTRKDYEADMRRAMFEQHSAAEYSKFITDDLKRYYPTVNQTSDMQLDDDIDKNIFTTTYNYEVDGFWQDGDKLSSKESAGYWIFKFEPNTLYSDFNNSGCAKRKFDYAQNYPCNMTYNVVFHFPKDLLIHDRYVKYDNVAFYFDEKIEQLSSNSFQICYSYRTKTKSIKVEDYEKICEEKNKIAKNLPTIIYFNK